MTDQKSKKKILITPPKRKIEVLPNYAPSTDLLLNDAKSIIAGELQRYRAKVDKLQPLDLKEARVVQGYVDSLSKLQREERESAMRQDLSNLSDAELLALANRLFKGSGAAPVLEDADKRDSKHLEDAQPAAPKSDADPED